MADTSEWLKGWAKESTDNFKKNHRIKSFKEYLFELKERPYSLSRNSVQYLLDMLEYFGEERTYSLASPVKKFKIFNQDFPNSALPKLVGQEEAILDIYSALKHFVLEGGADRIIHLHGPSCSGKSLIVEYLMKGIEEYSRKKEGALYSFHWVFPIEAGKRMGFGEKESSFEKVDSYATLSSDEISFRLPCDLNDAPILLIPPKRRMPFLSEFLKDANEEEKSKFIPTKYLLEADLCGRCREIFDALHDEYEGDVEQILKHIQVRRFYISKKYERGAVVISPQETPDAGSRLISADSNWDYVPPSLQHLVLEQINGSIISANNGIVEFSDFLTRPPEMNKYLLSAVDKGELEVSQNSISLNLVIFATSNEENLDNFKQNPDFPAFKGRMTFISVPYLLERSKEAKIHFDHLVKIGQYKHISPHLHYVSGLWSVLVRLLKPNPENYPKKLKENVLSITPYEKAVIYDTFDYFSTEMVNFDEGKIELIYHLKEEYKETQFYEGRFGFSPSDIVELFYNEAYNKENNCIGVFDFLDGSNYLIRDTSLFKFLQLKPDSHFHDFSYFADVVKKEYLSFFEDDLLCSLDIFKEYTPFMLLRNYFSALLQDKPANEIVKIERELRNGKEDKIYRNFIKRNVEESLKRSDWGFIPTFVSEANKFKKQKVSKNRDKILKTIENSISLLTGGEKKIVKEELKETERFVTKMIESYNYCPNCLFENLSLLLKERNNYKEKK